MESQTAAPVLHTTLTVDVILNKLQERCSQYDARLILDSAMVTSGVRPPRETMLDKEQASNLCLELIKKGGPAFQVGSALYRQYVQ